MALVNQDLVLDVVPGPIPPILHLTEYDENMEVVVTLQRRGQPFQIPTGTTVKIEGTLKGHPFSENGTPSGNTVTFMVSKNMTAYSGRAWTKIKLTQNSKPVSTCGFWLDCDRAGVEAETVIGAPGFEGQIQEAVEDWAEQQGFTSPTVEIETIEGGNRVIFFDVEHPQGQSIEVMDGVDGESAGVDGTYSFGLNNGYISTNGSISTATANQEVYTDKLPVSPGDKIQFSIVFGNTQANWVAYATYKADGTFISRVTLRNQVSEASFTSGELVMPSNAKFVSFTYRTYGDVQSVTIKNLGLIVDRSLSLDGVPADSKAVGDILKQPNAVENLLDSTSLVRGLIQSDGTIGTAYAEPGAAEKTSDFIEIEVGKNYAAKIFYPKGFESVCWSAYAFYNESKAKVGDRIAGTKELVSEGNSEVYTVDIVATDSRVKYVRFCYRSYNTAVAMFYEENGVNQLFRPSFEDFKAVYDVQHIPSPTTIKFPFKSINHRGYRGNGAPENTVPAFKDSKRFGFEIVETDVQETSDGAFVIWHDNTITINGTSKTLANCTLAEIQTVDLGTGDYAGTKIPTFSQFLEVCRDLCLYAYIEIKNVSKSSIASLVETARAYGILDRITWLSFSNEDLQAVSVAYPMARLCYTTRAVSGAETAAALRNGKNEVTCSSSVLTAEMATACLNAGVQYEVWSLNSESDILGLPKYCSGVTSDTLIAEKVLYDANIQ